MTCPVVGQECANPKPHGAGNCRCDCQRRLIDHPALPHPGKLQSWRDHHDPPKSSTNPGPAIDIHRAVDRGDGHCEHCGVQVFRWGDGRLRHARRAA